MIRRRRRIEQLSGDEPALAVGELSGDNAVALSPESSSGESTAEESGEGGAAGEESGVRPESEPRGDEDLASTAEESAGDESGGRRVGVEW
jgi:hypothetical protein